MLLFIVLSNLVCILLPARTSAHVTTPESPAILAAHQLKRLSAPLMNSLYQRDTILLAGTPEVPNGLRLNSTNGELLETIPFEAEIDIPGQGGLTDFRVKGEIDDGNLVTVEFYFDIHTKSEIDTRIGVYKGDLQQGTDMKIPPAAGVITGEALLFSTRSGLYDVLIFQAASGVVKIPGGPSKSFDAFAKAIKRWKHGNLKSIEDVPNNSQIQIL